MSILQRHQLTPTLPTINSYRVPLSLLRYYFATTSLHTQVGNCVVHEMDALISPFFLYRFLNAARLPGTRRVCGEGGGRE